MCKCKVSWCNKKTEKGRNGAYLKHCSIHNEYKNISSNAPSRPWLYYKVEKILGGEFQCEKCGFDPIKFYPNVIKRRLYSLMDVDHINPKIKGTNKGEKPTNYQLVCKHCHILKSHEDGDYTPKKYKK